MTLSEFALISAVHMPHPEVPDTSPHNVMTDFPDVDTVPLDEKVKAYRL